MLASTKPPKRNKDPSDYAIVGEIINPMALKQFKNDPRTQQKRLREEREKTVPEKPKSKQSGPGSRLNTSFFFTQYVTEGKMIYYSSKLMV